MSASGAVFNSFDFEGEPIKRKLALREQEPEGVASDSITWVPVMLFVFSILFYVILSTCGTTCL